MTIEMPKTRVQNVGIKHHANHGGVIYDTVFRVKCTSKGRPLQSETRASAARWDDGGSAGMTAGRAWRRCGSGICPRFNDKAVANRSSLPQHPLNRRGYRESEFAPVARGPGIYNPSS